MGLKENYTAASPDDAKIGRIDSLGVRNYADHAGEPAQPRAILRSYHVNNYGNVEAQTFAATPETLAHLERSERQQADNPNRAHNVAVLDDVQAALHATKEFGIDLGRTVTAADLPKLTEPKPVQQALKLDLPGVTP